MVQLASVIGRQFLVRLLERIADLTGPLEGLLTELQTLELIYRQGLLPEPAYVFKHALIQDVAYNSLLLRQRRELHRAVGAAIEELYPERLAEHYEELAHHFTQGEVWAKAMEKGSGGDRAVHAFANTGGEEALLLRPGGCEQAHPSPPIPGPSRACMKSTPWPSPSSSNTRRRQPSISGPGADPAGWGPTARDRDSWRG
jgi:hypothetical protein